MILDCGLAALDISHVAKFHRMTVAVETRVHKHGKSGVTLVTQTTFCRPPSSAKPSTQKLFVLVTPSFPRGGEGGEGTIRSRPLSESEICVRDAQFYAGKTPKRS